jgi:hypothetical protein
VILPPLVFPGQAILAKSSVAKAEKYHRYLIKLLALTTVGDETDSIISICIMSIDISLSKLINGAHCQSCCEY